MENNQSFTESKDSKYDLSINSLYSITIGNKDFIERFENFEKRKIEELKENKNQIKSSKIYFNKIVSNQNIYSNKIIFDDKENKIQFEGLLNIVNSKENITIINNMINYIERNSLIENVEFSQIFTKVGFSKNYLALILKLTKENIKKIEQFK